MIPRWITTCLVVLSITFTHNTCNCANTVKCGISQASSLMSHTRIVGGRNALPHEFPWMVYIQAEHLPNGQSTEGMGAKTLYTACGGTLIDDRWILTAGHCFNQQPNHTLHQVVLVLGAHDISNKQEDHFVVKPAHIYRNRDYQESVVTSKNDLTMVALPGRLNFSTSHAHLAPACLPTSDQSISKTHCQAAGWGKTGPKETDQMSAILKVVDHSLLTAEECHQYRPEVTTQQVCGGYAHQATCQGDSGGPFMCRNEASAQVLVGVTSYGDKQCGGNAPAVFTNVAHYMTWINQVRQSVALK